MSTTYLFVYGTLRRGYRNEFADLLSTSERFVGRGKIRGRLYRIGEYPGLVVSDNGEDWATGDVYLLREPAKMLRVLDEYESTADPPAFVRISAPVVLDSGEWIEALVYVYGGSVTGKGLIASGDFMAPG